MAAYTTIDNPELYFQVVLWTGNDTDGRTITLPGDEDMQPDLISIKNRGQTDNWSVYDVARGATKVIQWSTNNPQYTDPSQGWVSGFTSDGFTVTSGSTDDGNVNNGSETYVAYCWKAGGSGSSNTDGSINTTKTSANTTSGISIVTYTGDGNSSATLGHGLSSAPKVLLNKPLGMSGYDWNVQHGALGATKYLYLSSTAAAATATQMWNDTAPTSSVFTVGTYDNVNKVSETYLTYCFSEVQGYSKFGLYKGNDSADGTFVYTGFRPAWVMLKATSGGEGWYIVDNKRQGFNPENEELFAQSNGAEGTSNRIDLLSNGFKLRDNNSLVNSSSITSYIYMAFAEAPFVNSKGVPCNAR